MNQPLLSVDHLSTHLRNGDQLIKAVDDVSFQIRRGETFCLVGESGSGKSITALSIMRLLPKGIASHPSGVINLYSSENDSSNSNQNLLLLKENQLRDIRGARISMIFQEPMNSLNPVLTIGEQIIETLQIHYPQIDFEQARQRAIEILSQVQISQPELRIDEYPHRLSGGQRQRVMIAMALVCEPDLLIADEPTTALDVTVQAEILRLMQNLQKNKGTSILFITHDFGVVAQMAHHLAVMRLGKIVEQGEVAGVLRNPQHEYTQKLLASIPENLIKNRERSSNHILNPQKNSTSLIKIEKLKVYFPIKKGVFQRTTNYVRAVDDVSLEIPRGQIVALVGESGCGKTTVGRALLRLIEPTAGKCQFAGNELTQLSQKSFRPYRREMQFIFQDPMASLNPRLNIATTLTEPMAVHKVGSSQRERLDIARDMLNQVKLDPDFLWRYPHEFSGGQRQRIGIARALVLKPQFVVCDEVTSALDVSVQAEILQILQSLRASHDLSLMFITHNLKVVEYLAHQIAVMYLGKIVEYGTIDQVLSGPLHPYTQILLASVPSFEKSDNRVLSMVSGEIPSPINPPMGCHFHTRCPQAMPICHSVYPETISLSHGQRVACHLYTETAKAVS